MRSGLKEGVAAKNIVASSGLPKNTLSRAIQKLLHRRLLKRETDEDDLRSYVLRLTPAGRAIFDETMPMMVDQQSAMLSALTERRAAHALRADGQARHRLADLAGRSRQPVLVRGDERSFQRPGKYGDMSLSAHLD